MFLGTVNLSKNSGSHDSQGWCQAATLKWGFKKIFYDGKFYAYIKIQQYNESPHTQYAASIIIHILPILFHLSPIISYLGAEESKLKYKFSKTHILQEVWFSKVKMGNRNGLFWTLKA